jgi:hypothetical protein
MLKKRGHPSWPMSDTSKDDPGKLIDGDPLLREAMEEILRIQPRFSPEPIFTKTGVGQLKSEGVEELQKLKRAEEERNRQANS